MVKFFKCNFTPAFSQPDLIARILRIKQFAYFIKFITPERENFSFCKCEYLLHIFLMFKNLVDHGEINK